MKSLITPTYAELSPYVTLLESGELVRAMPEHRHIPIGKTLTFPSKRKITADEARRILRGEALPDRKRIPRKVAPENVGEMLKEAVTYNPDTGEVKAEGSIKARVVALTTGYVAIFSLGRMTLAHRWAWYLAHGAWPEKGMMVDHINCDRGDNRLCNLRLATLKQNFRNSRRSSRNTSGAKGVQKTRGGRWAARICADNVSHHLGTFNTVTEAADAYKEAALKLHGEFARFE